MIEGISYQEYKEDDMKNRKEIVSVSLMLLSLAGIVVLSAYGVTVATGKFRAMAMDTAGPRVIDTGLTHVRSLLIVLHVPKSAVQRAYTTDQIQADMPGAFLNGDKWDMGVSITGSTFILSHSIFKRPGVTFYWEAHGD